MPPPPCHAAFASDTIAWLILRATLLPLRAEYGTAKSVAFKSGAMILLRAISPLRYAAPLHADIIARAITHIRYDTTVAAAAMVTLMIRLLCRLR